MICPRCGAVKIIVKDSRKNGNEVLRKRQCLTCGKVLYTIEKIDTTTYCSQKLSEIHYRETLKNEQRKHSQEHQRT